jgi:hypothetical protein
LVHRANARERTTYEHREEHARHAQLKDNQAGVGRGEEIGEGNARRSVHHGEETRYR